MRRMTCLILIALVCIISLAAVWVDVPPPVTQDDLLNYTRRDGSALPTGNWSFVGRDLLNVGNLKTTGTLYSPDLQTSFTNTAKTNAANDWHGYAQTNFGNMTGTGTLTVRSLQVNGLNTTDGWGTTITAGAATKAVRGLVILTSGTTGKVDRALDVSGTTGFTSSDHLIYAKSNAYLTGDGDWIGRNMIGLEGVSAGMYYPYSGNWKMSLWTASDRYTFFGRPTTGVPVVTTGSAVGEWSMARLSTRSQFVSDTSYSIRASVERRSQTLLTTGTSAVDFVMPDMATLWSRNHETTGTVCAEFTISNQSDQTNRIEAGASARFRMAGTNYTELVLNAGATVTLMQAPRPAWQWIVKFRDGTVSGQ